MQQSSKEPSVPLFSERPGWEDVVPVEQYETLEPLAPIFYTPAYKDAMDYFRAIVRAGEKSARVLELTEAVIRLNPSHYTAWQYRFDTLLALNAPLTKELALMDELVVRYLKIYQVWHHRQLLMTLLRTPRAELRFIARSLEKDAKNYHTWSYRQWLLVYFGGELGEGQEDLVGEGDEGDETEDLWAGELPFVERMISEDIRNNSSWHHRYFVVWGCGVRAGDEDRMRVLHRELVYVKQQISFAPNNASAWNYLRGTLRHTHTPLVAVSDFVLPFTRQRDKIGDLKYTGAGSATKPSQDELVVDLENPLPEMSAELPCAAAVEFLADAYEEMGTREGVFKAVALWKTLASELDTIRKKYWEYRIREALQGLPSESIQK